MSERTPLSEEFLKKWADYLVYSGKLYSGTHYVFRNVDYVVLDVIKSDVSYGGECDLWEGMICWDGRELINDLTGDDVAGYLDEEQLDALMEDFVYLGRDGKLKDGHQRKWYQTP